MRATPKKIVCRNLVPWVKRAKVFRKSANDGQPIRRLVARRQGLLRPFQGQRSCNKCFPLLHHEGDELCEFDTGPLQFKSETPAQYNILVEPFSKLFYFAFHYQHLSKVSHTEIY
jgi:hypothetical protein